MRMITCVAWKANKVLDGSRLLVLIKNHRQLNCSAVVLYWPVIASETGEEIVRGTAAESSVQFLPPWPPLWKKSLDFAKFLRHVPYHSAVTSPRWRILLVVWEAELPGTKMSLELILHAAESQVMHLRYFCPLRPFFFFPTRLSRSKPLMKRTSAELCIFLNWGCWPVIHCS